MININLMMDILAVFNFAPIGIYILFYGVVKGKMVGFWGGLLGLGEI